MEWLWLALAALTPALFDPASLRVYEPEKIAFVRAVALLLLALWALESLSLRGNRPHPDPPPKGEGENGSPASPHPRAPSLVSPFPRGEGGRGQGSEGGRGVGSVPRLPVPFLAPVAALVAAYLLAATLSEMPAVSLLGSYRRQFGALTHLSYAAVFLVVAARLRTEAQVRRLLLAVALGTLFPALYALAQKVGLDVMPWTVDVSYRVVGSLGQPTYLASYLAAAMPATLHLAATAASRRRGGLLAGLLALQGAALLFSGSRGGWLAAVVGCAVVMALVPAGRRIVDRLGRRRLVAGVVAAVCVMVLLNLPGTEVNRLARSVPYVERLASVADLGSGSGGVRTLIWREIPALVAERPLLGHGPEMMGYAFERHYPPELAYAENRTAAADRAHNLLLEALVSAGLLGLVAWLWLLAVVVRSALRGSEFWVLSSGFGPSPQPSPKGRGGSLVSPSPLSASPRPRVSASSPPVPPSPRLGVPALAGLAAFLVDGMVGVPSASAYLLFWLYLAVVAWGVRAREETVVEGTGAVARLPHDAARRDPVSKHGRRASRGGAGERNPAPGAAWLRHAASAAVLVAVALGSLRPLAADVVAARASGLASEGRFPEADEAFRQALGLQPEAEYHLLLGQTAMRAAERGPAAAAEGWWARAEESLRAAQGMDARDLDVALAQGKLYQTRAGLARRPADWAGAEVAFRRALDLSPRRSYVRNRYGALQAAQGRHAEAVREYRLSLELDPRYAATHGFLADSLAALGRTPEALAAYEEARRLDPELVLVRINLGELYLRLGRPREAATEYEAAVALAPEDRRLRLRLEELRRVPG